MSRTTGQSTRRAPLLTIKEAAEVFHVSTKTVRRWIAAGDLRAHQLGRQWRIGSDEVERFLYARSNWLSKHFT